jgi:HEAT repeat protein
MELLSEIIVCHKRMNDAFAPLSQKDILFLKNYFSEMLLKDKMMLSREAPGRSGPPQRTLLKRDEHYAKETAFRLSSTIRRDALYRAGIALAAAIDRLLERSDQLGTIKGSAVKTPAGNIRGDIIVREDTPWGSIIIGGRGPGYYRDINPLLIIDLGGDDEYHNVSTSPSLSPFNAATSVIIDLGGNDLYRSTKKYSQGSAVFGCSFLIDCDGDDTYLAADISQGCGFFGVGVLDDRKGNDRYRADTMAQGAAAFGIGIIADREGNDSYQGSLYNQGSAFTGGVGLLVDGRGDDTFFAGGTYPDSREPQGAFVSFAQGCGFGDRNYASGGLGILWNGSGNDTYSGSYFAQGAGYWQGAGLLIDRAGDDRYEARRYAQGAATHRAAGALADHSGNDAYVSWGASQGCGYDYAQGLLSDANGDDVYHAEWFAQGVGGKSGTGMLIDHRGNDSYRSGSFCSQGDGQYWDEEKSGSIGLVLDCSGSDAYSGGGKNSHLWRQGQYGGGIDTSARLAQMKHPALPAPKEVHRSADRPDAGTGTLFERYEPLPELEIDLNYEDARQESVRQLAAAGPSVVPRLLEYVRINDVQLSFTVREIIAGMGADAAPALREALNDQAQDRVVASFILSMLGDLHDDGSGEAFLSFLQSEDGMVRTASMRGISRMPNGLPPGTLIPFASDGSPAVRKFCAIALGSSRETEALKTLTGMLGDEYYGVRFAAFESLRDNAPEASPYLREMIHQPEGFPEYARELAKDLLEGKSGQNKQAGKLIRGAP